MLYIEEIWVKGCFLIYEEVKHPVITPLNLHLYHGRSIGTIRCNREWRRTCSPYTYKNSSVFRIKAAAIGGDSIRKKKTAGSQYDQAFYSGHFVW